MVGLRWCQTKRTPKPAYLILSYCHIVRLFWPESFTWKVIECGENFDFFMHHMMSHVLNVTRRGRTWNSKILIVARWNVLSIPLHTIKKKKNTLVSTIGFNQFPHHRTHRLNLWAHLALNNRRQLESKMDGPLARTTVEIELAWNWRDRAKINK